MAVIYKITSPTGKVYIGQTWNFSERVYFYRTIKCKGQVKVYNSLKKHGFDSHKIEVICELPNDVTQCVLNSYEKFYWERYIDCGLEMLNLKEPGSNGRLSEESIQKISRKLKGRKLSQDHVKNMANSKIGVPCKEDTKEKISIANSGKKNGMFGRFGKLNPASKRVIDTSTNRVFESVREAEVFYNIKKNILAAKLNGRARNNTTLKYL